MNIFWDDFEDTNNRDNKMKFTVTPAFTRETEQQPRGTAINPEKYRRCMRLRIESIKWFLVNLGFIFFSNFMLSHQIWKKSSIWLALIYGWRNPKILTHSVVCFFTSPLTFIEQNLTKEKTHTTSCSFVSVQFEKKKYNIYIYIFKRTFQWWAKRAQQISNHLCRSAFLKNKK